MWKSAQRFGNNAQDNEDSDQSISEEEVLEDKWMVNTASLGRAGENEGRRNHILSQLETLADPYELQSTEEESISPHERKESYNIDDEVENPLFNDGDGSRPHPRIISSVHNRSSEGLIHMPTVTAISHSDEEIIYDDENAGDTWSEASREAEALVWLNENSSCSSYGVSVKENKSFKGTSGRARAKPKFLFRFHSRNKDPSLVGDENGITSSNNVWKPDEIGAAADKDTEKCVAQSQLILHEKESEETENHTVPAELDHEHEFKEHSVAEFLDCFQGRNDLLHGSSELAADTKSRGKRLQMVLKRNTHPLGNRNLNDDDLADSDCSDGENPTCIRPVVARRTIVDQFHEVFGTVSVIDERPLCNGLYEKLQQVMQNQKERDVEYLKNISTMTVSKDENMCIFVRILSRSLEAKLILCSCISIEDEKNSFWESNLDMKVEGGARSLTIIFNPRVCSDVEVEVGNMICIHPPWKEVQVKGKDEVIFLCSYFSQVQS